MNKNTITQDEINALSTIVGYVMINHKKSDDHWIKPLAATCQELREKIRVNLDAETKEFKAVIDEDNRTGKIQFVPNEQSQLSRIEETVNWIKEALQPMESEIEFNLPKEGFVFEPKSKTGLSVEDNNVYFKDPKRTVIDVEYNMHRKNRLCTHLPKGETLLQELVEKWKAKEQKPLLTNVSDALYSLLSSKPISEEDRDLLRKNGILYRPEKPKPLLTDIFIQMLRDRLVVLNDKRDCFSHLAFNTPVAIQDEIRTIEQILKTYDNAKH